MSAALAGAVVAVFGRLLGAGFLVYDDPAYVTHNLYVLSGVTADGLAWAWRTTLQGSWHPLTWVSHMLDVELFGLSAGGHHATSVVLHAANTLLVFRLLDRATGSTWRAAAVAALFGLHPLHVESVAWIAERKDVLSTLFGLLALVAYVGWARQGGRLRYGAVVLFYLASLMAKPMLVSLPILLLLLDFWPLDRLGGSVRGWLGPLLEKLPLFLMAAAASGLAFWSQSREGAVQTVLQYGVAERLSNALLSYWRYLGKTAWPTGLSIFYPYPRGFPLWATLIAAVCLAGVTLLLVAWSRRWPHLLVGWLWYLVALLPVVGLVQIGGQAMADRYTYVPLVGVFVAVCWAVPVARRHRWVTALGVLALLSALALVTWSRVGLWCRSADLFAQAARVSQPSYVIEANLGMARLSVGDGPGAVEAFREAARLQPRVAEAHVNLGVALVDIGSLEEAVLEYRKAIAADARYAEAWSNLGQALGALGRERAAGRVLQHAVGLDPEHAAAQYNLGKWLQRAGRQDLAERHFRLAVRADPLLCPAQRELADLAAERGEVGSAAQYLARVVGCAEAAGRSGA